MHAITCASSPAPPRSTLKQGYMGSVHVWEGSAARAARRERGRGLPNREGATSGGNTWTGVRTQNFCHFSCHLMCSPLFLLARCLQS